MAQAGFNSSESVRRQLQAALYFNRKRRRQRGEDSGQGSTDVRITDDSDVRVTDSGDVRIVG